MIIHTTAAYDVVASDLDKPLKVSGYEYDSAYVVYNRETTIWEYVTPSLPEAIHAAEGFQNAIDNKPWEWRNGSVDPDGTPLQ